MPLSRDGLAEVRKLLKQQAAIAQFGKFALGSTGRKSLLGEAARACSAAIEAQFCVIFRHRKKENDFRVEASTGWDKSLFGKTISKLDETCPQTHAFSSLKPVIYGELNGAPKSPLSHIYAKHKIASTVDVVIPGATTPYGVLEVASARDHHYDADEVLFITSFAEVLGNAVAKSDNLELLKTSIRKMKKLIEEKNRDIEKNKILSEELNHRIINNLQLVYHMINQQLDVVSSENDKKGIKAIARRVVTLASVYNNLSGYQMAEKNDFGASAKTLCADIAEFQRSSKRDIHLECESERLIVRADLLTTLGIIVAELVTNSYDHACPSNKGHIKVSVLRGTDHPHTGKILIQDDGRGFDVHQKTTRRGINLVRSLIELIKGNYHVDTSPNGTQWTILFPLSVK